ncbi:exodeoxyribonuclease III [Candidatus Kinetoplastibacterium desouzaii TCC079E]|uniref:Exodeoxyribonuclease III n=1 Tax=Candidatus Kinetoplastidibacterium desouzai TCC079E TaxID=1208919 RepID=M1M4V9_9PROT|nr:exodeoxyribonuclease III [Candidatus Kinetoplastibacterium desouzaii]AGF47220.1 exodeoxyribonuclease III [Candidatus Kinetoplastibacterium desouzaii TCC079E]
MLKITSINVNGIRSAFKKNFNNWLATNNSDVICLQEIRISNNEITNTLLNPIPFYGHFYSAEKRGYSGVGIYTKKEPNKITNGLGVKEFDSEARIMRADWDSFSIINAYFPSGSSGEHRQLAKMRFLNEFELYIQDIIHDFQRNKKHFFICGDLNIAHDKIDIKNWKNNINKPGFLPEERNWLTKILKEYKLVDVFRKINPTLEEYTWWSNRANSRERNIGWRIDYQITTTETANLAKTHSIYRIDKFSDHAPLTIDYDINV